MERGASASQGGWDFSNQPPLPSGEWNAIGRMKKTPPPFSRRIEETRPLFTSSAVSMETDAMVEKGLEK